MSGIESIGGFSANVPATERFSTIRTQITEKIKGNIDSKIEEKLKSAGVSEDTREALLADVSQVIERQLSSGGRPDPKAIRETIGSIFEKHGLSLPDGLEQGAGRLGLLGEFTSTGAAVSPQFDAIQSLIENLQAASSESRDNQYSAYQYASNLVNGLLRFDAEA